jgi:hypothetical protein
MRLRNALAIGVTAATIAPAVLTVSAATAAAGTARGAVEAIAGPAAARPAADVTAPPVAKPSPRPGQPQDQQPSCGKASAPDFPIDTRIHGGPEVHHPGGDSRQWSVDLTNTTDETCHNIHPVVVFTARDRGLTPSLVRLEFYDTEADRWHPVALETTAEDEIVGVLDGPGFPGFAVPARKSLTVDVRLALAADTTPNEVTANAAIVQRQGDDGDWVGESGDYRFAVVEDDGSGSIVTLDELATTGTDPVLRLVVGIGAVLLGSGTLVLAARRFRAGRRP